MANGFFIHTLYINNKISCVSQLLHYSFKVAPSNLIGKVMTLHKRHLRMLL